MEPPVSAVLRGFCQRPEDAPARARVFEQAIDRLLGAKVDGDIPLVDRVIVVVCEDNRYPEFEASDALAGLIRGRFLGNDRVVVRELNRGDIYVAAGNYGLSLAKEAGAEWGLTMSPEAVSYLTQGVIDSLARGMYDHWCHAVGVALKEVEDTVREGRLAGTLAAWRLETFFSAGGLPMAVARRPPEWETPTVEFNGGQIPLHGVEEVPLLIAIAMMRGLPFIRVITADGGEYRTGGDAWQTDPTWATRTKFDNKRVRQDAHVQRIFGLLDAGILRDYIIR